MKQFVGGGGGEKKEQEIKKNLLRVRCWEISKEDSSR